MPAGSGKKAAMGIFTLSMLNIAAVLSIVNFPEQAEYGYRIVFYITASALCFFMPTALVSAELASAWPKDGGVYLWVREAFGPRWGFVTGVHAVAEQPAVVCNRADLRGDRTGVYLGTGAGEKPLVRLLRGGRHRCGSARC